MGAARRGAAGGVLLHVHDAALARGRQQGAAADDVELPGGRVSRAVHARRTGDAAALDGHRLHRPRRSPGRSHLSASRAALRSAAWSVLVVAPFFVLGLGGVAFDDPGEGMHAEIARELSASGDLLRLTLNGVAYVDKPPLLYTLLATGFALGGASETSARLVPALAALAAVAATGWLGARLLGARGGFVAGAALATSCGFFVYGRYVRPETLFVAAIATGFALSLSGVMEGRRLR